jgi:hypothetical protein
MREKMDGEGIVFQSPKMGDHITFISPFRASELEIQWLAAGLSFCKAFHNADVPRCVATSERLHFFRNEDVDALVVRITVNQQLRDIVEQWRSKLPKTNEWVYPPDSYLFNAHATVAEGKKLFNHIAGLGGAEKAFKEIAAMNKIVVPIDYPIIWEKTANRQWKPVHF